MASRPIEQLKLAVSRPDLLVRKIRGLDVISISLNEIAPFIPDEPVVLEAGAFDGTDTASMAARWPGGVIHALEPIESSFRLLKETTATLGNVVPYNVGLAPESGMKSMRISENQDGSWRPDSSSILEPLDHLSAFPSINFSSSVDVQCFSVDDWALEYGIDRVDFMWLDLQGAEGAVLNGGQRVLEGCTAVLAEVSRKMLYRDSVLYHDFVRMMDGWGFRRQVDRVAVEFGNILFVRHP